MAGPARLRRSADVVDVLRRGRRRAGRLAVVHVRPRLGEPPRVAVVASKRVGDAVARNRAKRLLREASMRVDLLPADHVLVARNTIANASMDDVRSDLVDTLSTLSEQMFDSVPR